MKESLPERQLPRDTEADGLRGRPHRILRFANASHGSLERNTAHVFAQKHALSIYRSNAVYSFIPKNACSTLRFSIARENGCITSDEDIRWLYGNNATFRASLRELVRAEYAFVVLRCPYRRLVSLFLDKIAGDVGDNRLRILRRRDWRRVLRSRSGDRRQITFRKFLALLARPGAIDIDHHWVPQYRFLVYATYDDVFRVEAIDEARDRLRERIGLELYDARRLTQHGTTDLRRKSVGMCADMPGVEIEAMRAEGYVPDYSDFFDSETRARCERLYGKDIDLFSAHFGREALLFRS